MICYATICYCYATICQVYYAVWCRAIAGHRIPLSYLPSHIWFPSSCNGSKIRFKWRCAHDQSRASGFCLVLFTCPLRATSSLVGIKLSTPILSIIFVCRLQNFSIRFFRTVHILARLPYTYIGMEKSMHASWIPPTAMKVFLGPDDSSQWGKNREKIKPWRISFAC